MKNKVCFKEERLMVLNMLQEGKINVDEATRLLDNLKPSNNCNESEKLESVFQKKLNTISENVEGISKEVGDKLGNILRKFEPRAKSATKKVVEKTISVMNNISKALDDNTQLQDENLQEQEKKDSYDA